MEVGTSCKTNAGRAVRVRRQFAAFGFQRCGQSGESGILVSLDRFASVGIVRTLPTFVVSQRLRRALHSHSSRSLCRRQFTALTALRTVAVVAFAMLAIRGQAAVRYWDTDGSTAGNNASTGANLGGSGTWSATNINWWNTSVGPLQGWASGSDAIFWGTGRSPVTASTVSVGSLAFKTNGYSVTSGTLT